MLQIDRTEMHAVATPVCLPYDLASTQLARRVRCSPFPVDRTGVLAPAGQSTISAIAPGSDRIPFDEENPARR